MQQAPSNAAINRDYFTAMNEYSRDDDIILLCRIIRVDNSGDVELQYFPQATDTIVMQMATNGGVKFNGKARNYQKSCARDGRPDRSKAGPF